MQLFHPHRVLILGGKFHLSLAGVWMPQTWLTLSLDRSKVLPNQPEPAFLISFAFELLSKLRRLENPVIISNNLPRVNKAGDNKHISPDKAGDNKHIVPDKVKNNSLILLPPHGTSTSAYK